MVTAAAAFAGGHEGAKAKNMSKEDMAAMKAEMMKCSVCKSFAANFETICTNMSTEVVRLDKGVAVVHSLSDPKAVPTYHQACAEMHTAGKAAMGLPEAEMKAALCDHCEQIVGLVQAGAVISLGDTKDGSIMVLTSNDPAVQSKIAAYSAECEKQMSMAPSTEKGM
jgi:hypothetical protein